MLLYFHILPFPVSPPPDPPEGLLNPPVTVAPPEPPPATIILDFKLSKSFQFPAINLTSVAPPPAPPPSLLSEEPIPAPPPLNDVLVSWFACVIPSAPVCPTYMYNFSPFVNSIVPDAYPPKP